MRSSARSRRDVRERAADAAARARGSSRPRAARWSCPTARGSPRTTCDVALELRAPGGRRRRARAPLRRAQLLDLLRRASRRRPSRRSRAPRPAGRARSSSSCDRARSRARPRRASASCGPGTGSHSPRAPVAHRAAAAGRARPGVSCSSGAGDDVGARAEVLRGQPRERARRRALNASQSVFASHGGGIAALNGCTNGCRSVLERSCFSYQVAAGRTTSEYRHEPFMRKSIVVKRSIFPVGRLVAPVDVLRALLGRGLRRRARRRPATPRMCRRKYSWPLLEEPSRFARQSVRTRG